MNRIYRIMEYQSDGTFIVDCQFRYLYCNRRYLEILRRENDHPLGKLIWEIFPSLVGTEIEDLYRMTMKTRKCGEVVLLSPLSQRWIRVRSFPTPDGMAAYIQDIHDEKMATILAIKKEQEFRTLADIVPHFIWTADPDGTVNYYNERWYEYTGFDRNLKGDESWEQILLPDDLERIKSVWYECIKTGLPYKIEHRLKDRKTGSFRWFVANAEPARDETGAIVRWFGTSTDIHEKKLIEDELKKSKEDCEIQVEDRTRRLKESNEELERFAYIAAHDLQDPLRSMNAFLKLIRDRYHNPEALELMDLVLSQGQKMKELTTNILKYAKITGLTLDLKKVDTNETVSDVINALQLLINEKNGLILVEWLPSVIADSIQIRQVFQNLIQNALKYSHPDRKPEVAIHGWETDDLVWFEVKDNGFGVKELDPFVPLRRNLPGDKGVGFGLAITRRILEHHGGGILMDTSPNGTSFQFFLPKNQPLVG